MLTECFLARFYIVVLGIAFFSGRIYFFHILFGPLFSFYIRTFISLFFFGLLFPFSIWTIFSQVFLKFFQTIFIYFFQIFLLRKKYLDVFNGNLIQSEGKKNLENFDSYHISFLSRCNFCCCLAHLA